MSKMRKFIECLRALADVLEEEDDRSRNHTAGAKPHITVFAMVRRKEECGTVDKNAVKAILVDNSPQAVEALLSDTWATKTSFRVELRCNWETILADYPDHGLLILEL